jgi:TolB-like protein/predicted Zn-dependent protease
MPLASGMTLGPYQIVSPLGAGGMGEVYRARDARLDRAVALKVLPSDVAGDPVRLERFGREARAIAALNHPHIVTIYSTEEAEGIRFMTMELVEGQALDAVLATGSLSVARFLDLALPLADALTAAHQKQITHRDLKPGNVMVSGDGRVKVLDFGLARLGADEADPAVGATRAALTSEGTIVGTMPYMSPEQVEGRALDPRSDLFSLGVMFFEMLTGARPFQGPSSPALMSAILRDTPPLASDARPDVPEALARLIARCLEKRPDDRVQTARDVYNELRQIQKQLESGVGRWSGSAAMPNAEASLWIAVLPFGTRSADADTEALAAGLTEDITSGLSRFPALSVVAPQSARGFRDSPLDVRHIAERLGARYVMGGTVRRSASAVRIAAHLVDARSGAHLWAETYDKPVAGTDLFSIQDEVADRIVATVADAGGVLLRSMGTAIRHLPLEGLGLDELVLRYQLYTDQFTAADHAALSVAFETLVAREPGAARAWACLGMLVAAEMFFGLNPRPRPLERLREYAERATTLDSSIQYGWTATAVLAMFDRDRAALDAAADRAIALNPLHTRTLAVVGVQLVFSGETDRGVALLERAMALNPRYPGWYLIGPFLQAYERSDYEAALRHARRIGMPKFVPGLFAAASAAGRTGSVVDARSAVEALARISRALLEPAEARRHWEALVWDSAVIDRLVEGFTAARSIAVPATQLPSSADGAARPPSSPPTPASVAVLPFADRSPAKDQEWFCDGIAEEILNALTGLAGLRVAARTSAFSFRGREADLRAIADALGVETVLQGSLRRAGDRVRITVQLVDTRSGFQLWSERHDREIADIFDVQDEIARGVAERLKVTLDSAADRHVARRPRNVEAYELYLKGRGLLNQRGAGMLPALEAFRQSVELDPDFALAWAGIADTYTVLGYMGALPVEDMRRRCLGAAARALALAPDSAEAHTAAAGAALLYRGDKEQAGRSFQRALALNPAYVLGRSWYALFYLQWTLGWMDEGIQEARKAVETDPLSSFAHLMLSAAFYTAERYAEAVDAARRALALDPRAFPPHWILAESLGRLGQVDAAFEVLDRGTEMSHRHPLILLSLSQVLAAAGRRADADAVYRELVERARTTHVNDGQLAAAAWYAGHADDAVGYARRALATREPLFLLAARFTPAYRDMQDDPRIAAIVSELDGLAPMTD